MNRPDGGPGDAGRAGTRPSARFLLVVGLLVAAAFGIGFGWQYLEARSARTERDALQAELAFQELATTLAAATIQAEYGGYEGARELMSRFFTTLQDHLGRAPAQTRNELAAILETRDAVITSLSRSEEASRTRLARLFVHYQTVLGGPEGALPLPEPGVVDRPDTTGGGASEPPDSGGGP